MSKHILRDAVIEINGVPLSAKINNVEVHLSREKHDVTGFTDAGKVQLNGDRNDMVTADFFQDFDASQVHATLWPLFDDGDEFTISVKPFNEAMSDTNPGFAGVGTLADYTPIKGKRGDVHQITCEFDINGKLDQVTSDS